MLLRGWDAGRPRCFLAKLLFLRGFADPAARPAGARAGGPSASCAPGVFMPAAARAGETRGEKVGGRSGCPEATLGSQPATSLCTRRRRNHTSPASLWPAPSPAGEPSRQRSRSGARGAAAAAAAGRLGLGAPRQPGPGCLPVPSPRPHRRPGAPSKPPAERRSLPGWEGPAGARRPAARASAPASPRPPGTLSAPVPRRSAPRSLSEPLPTNSLACPASASGERASRAQSGPRARAFAGSPRGRRISGRRAAGRREALGGDGCARSASRGAAGRARGMAAAAASPARHWRTLSLRSAAAEAPLPHWDPTRRYRFDSLLPLSVAQLPARRVASPSCQTLGAPAPHS